MIERVIKKCQTATEWSAFHPFRKPIVLTEVAGMLEFMPPVFGHQAGYTLELIGSQLQGTHRQNIPAHTHNTSN